jgi:hypothetical protein
MVNGKNDAKKVTKIDSSSLAQNNASNYAYSVWFYIEDWSYRYGEPKIVLGRLDNELNPSPSIVLGAIENNLFILLLNLLLLLHIHVVLIMYLFKNG